MGKRRNASLTDAILLRELVAASAALRDMPGYGYAAGQNVEKAITAVSTRIRDRETPRGDR